MRQKYLLLITVFLLFSSTSYAQDFYQGIRQMGMGGAAVAVVNDETALLLNPNGLARLRETYLTFFDVEATSGMDNVSETGSLSTDAIEPEAIYEELAEFLDQDYFARVQTFPSVVRRGFGIGFLAKYDVRARRLSSNQNVTLNYTSDWMAVVGYNHSFWGGIVKIGATAKLIDRVEFNGTVDPVVSGLDIDTLGSEGLGLGADVALSLSSPTDLLPTISAVVRDVGDTSFGFGDGFRDVPNTVEPTPLKQRIDAAFAFFPIHSPGVRSTFTIEYRDLMEDGPFLDSERRLHAGAEMNFSDKYFFRVGYNQGYLTGGLEWATSFTQFQLAYYGEEIGTDANPVQEDRVAMKLVLRF